MQESMETILFTRNAQHAKREKILTVITVLMGMWMIIQSISYGAILPVVFFGAITGLGVNHWIKIIKNKPSVIVNERGITSKTNFMGLVSWDHITGFELKQIGRSVLLVVLVRDSKKVLNERSWMARILMSTNTKRLGSPVVIPASEFDRPMEEVFDIVDGYNAKIKTQA